MLQNYSISVSRQVHDDRNEEETTTTSKPTTTTTKSTTTTRPRTTTPYDDYDDYNEIDDGTNVGSDEEEMKPTTTQKTVTINYDGDYESVDDHRRKKSNVTDEDQSPADICRGQFDAVSVLRSELFFFKGQVSVNTTRAIDIALKYKLGVVSQYVWRLRQRPVIDHGYPVHIRHLFRELPPTLSKVDALYERPNGHIVFFSGKQDSLSSS